MIWMREMFYVYTIYTRVRYIKTIKNNSTMSWIGQPLFLVLENRFDVDTFLSF